MYYGLRTYETLLPSIVGNYPEITSKKIIITALDKFKHVYIDEKGKRVVRLFDLTGIRDGINYTNTADKPLISIEYSNSYSTHQAEGRRIALEAKIYSRNVGDNYLSGSLESDEITVYPIFSLADGETATDEPATETIHVPFETETDELWQDMMQRRLTVVSDIFEKGIDQKWVPLLTLARDYHGEVGPVKTRRQYDNTLNWAKGMIGHAWNQIQDALSNKRKKPSRSDVETLIENIEALIVDEKSPREFFHQHDRIQWWNAHDNRQIRLSKPKKRDNGRPDFKGAPGIVLRDIDTEHTSKRDGILNATTAEAEWTRCHTTCFEAAWGAEEREHLTEIEYSLGWD